MRRWLLLRLEAPLMAFGGVAIDHVRPTFDFPSASLLTGLFGNALGWRRTDRERHQRLQDRLIFGARREREPIQGVLLDVQNVQMRKSDRGWTTRGAPEGRDGASYDAPHRRLRDYHPDALVLVALTLSEEEETPTLDVLANALDHPARPLFIGRKPCIPSAPLRLGLCDAANAHTALTAQARLDDDGGSTLRALWPEGEGPATGAGVERAYRIADLRNWISGLHGGDRLVFEGRMTPPERVGGSAS